jgi:D-amino-acid oxidase
MRRKKAVVLGAGINGLTCGLVFQQGGYNTRIITAAEWKNDSDNPFFASLYPASSIKPVTVKSPILHELVRESRQRFSELLSMPGAGVRQHKHFEIFEQPEAEPDYAREMSNFQLLENGTSENIPRRHSRIPTWGWSYDVLFADTPLYLPWLRKQYLNCGGEIHINSLVSNDISKLPEELVINCTGTGAVGLFEDYEDDVRFVKGHQIIIRSEDIPKSYRTTDFSYNYTAGKSVYRNPDGLAADVYFYPRSDCWIIGASRQECQFDDKGNITEEPPVHESMIIGNIAVPAPMYEINRAILLETLGVQIGDLPKTARYGYRFIRKNKGLRLEIVKRQEKYIIHNYGHGGAGVTLSWGCAFKVLELAREAASVL